MKKIMRYVSLLSFIIILLITKIVFAGTPVFTFTPLTATTVGLSPNASTIVQYSVQNQSSLTHILAMTPIAGVTQVISAGSCPNPFLLYGKQSCTLTLMINASQLSSNIQGGPVVCETGTPLLCYQPNLPNVLNITLLPPPPPPLTVSASAGANGSVSPNTIQVVSPGSSLLFTATPDANYVVNQWLVDDVVVQTGGTTFLFSQITANHTVKVTFTNASVFYAGAQNGAIYYSYSNGSTWAATPHVPVANIPINSVFATVDSLYSANANGYIYYSTNNGSSWNRTNSPDGSSVKNVFAANNLLYAGTANGNILYSANNGTTWTAVTSPDHSAVNGIFVTGNTIYAGTASGNVYYSANNGSTWAAINGLPDGSAVKSVFVSNNNIYVGTANEYVYSSPAITGGGSWTAFAQTVYSLFVKSSTAMYAGTQGGYIYDLSTDTELGFVAYSPLNSVYVLN